MSDYSVSIADWRRDENVIRAIRRDVFIVEQGVSETLELDPQDYQHTHALAHDSASNGIATGRLLDDGQIGRMAVLAAWRGRGVGNAILECLIDAATVRGLPNVMLHAQIHAQAFYAARGFVATGDVFIEAGIEHIIMTRMLAPRT